jgi:hypothetical protein
MTHHAGNRGELEKRKGRYVGSRTRQNKNKKWNEGWHAAELNHLTVLIWYMHYS